MSASGEYEGERLLSPTSPNVDVGRMGIGQDKLEVTPLQMAEVAAAVANGGRLMVPHLTDRIVNAEGRTVKRIDPARAVGRDEAINRDGRHVDDGGRRQRRHGHRSRRFPACRWPARRAPPRRRSATRINNVWFIAFAPAADPRVAVAVTLRRVPGQGAAFAAPVAKQVMESLLP